MDIVNSAMRTIKRSEVSAEFFSFPQKYVGGTSQEADPLDKWKSAMSYMIEITKDTIIGDILDVAPQTAPIFLSIGMHCLGCPSSRGETVEEACAVHGIDVDKLLAVVNEEANKPIAE